MAKFRLKMPRSYCKNYEMDSMTERQRLLNLLQEKKISAEDYQILIVEVST